MFKVEIKKKNSSHKTLSLQFCWPLITFLFFYTEQVLDLNNVSWV